jgi:uncharacterized protein (TIGR02270 family)
MKIIPLILTQHAEDASHLWNVRSTAVGSADYTFRDLADLDHRLEANLDGLQIAGEDGWNVLKNEVGWRTPGDLFCATVLALGGVEPQPKYWAEVLASLREEPEFACGVVSGLGWLEFAKIDAPVDVLLADSSFLHQRIGVAAMVFHRRDPGQRLRVALLNSDLELRAAALKAAGELGRTDLLPLIAENLAASDPNVKFWAAWAHALLSTDGKPLATLRAVAESSHLRREQALQMALARMGPLVAKQWISELMTKPSTHRLACLAIGMFGDGEFLPWAITQMKSPLLARVAGDALTRITGIDLALHDLEGSPPEGIETGPNDDPKDDNIAMDNDADLRWPDARKVEAWWAKQQNDFPRGTAYLAGQMITPDVLEQVLSTGGQRYREAAALVLALRQPGKPLFNVTKRTVSGTPQDGGSVKTHRILQR